MDEPRLDAQQCWAFQPCLAASRHNSGHIWHWLDFGKLFLFSVSYYLTAEV
jgi:hypothetical protein